MKKTEFIKKLRKRLEVLEDKEIEDIVSEYEGYIDEKVASGLTEEEAVKELGDFEEIVSDLLAAYKVKSNSYEENTFNRIINKISVSIDHFMDSLNDKSGRDIVKTLIEIILILFLICLLKIPFAMIRDLGASIFEELVNPIGRIFGSIWTFIIEIGYIITSVIFFIKMFEKRYFKDISENIVNSHDEEKEKKNEKKSAQEPKETTKTKVIKPKKVQEEPKEHHGLVDAITDFCVLILKFIVLLILIGIVFYLIGMAFALGFMIYLLCCGVKYIGIFLLVLSLFLGGTLLLELCVSFICNKRTKASSFFSRLIIIIILTGVGLTMSAVEIAETEVIYGITNTPTKSVTKEIEMTDDLELYNFDRLVIDNTLEDKIIIEYNYPSYNDSKIDIRLDNCGHGICLGTDVTYAHWNKYFIKEFIKGLKNKKIYTSDYRFEKVIHISEANAKIIQKNNHYEEYYHGYNEENKIFTKTFFVNNVQEDINGNYIYLSLTNYEIEEDPITVKVPKGLATHVIGNNFYEFTFEKKYNDYYNEYYDDIEGIFDECSVLKIVLTAKEPIPE